MSLPAACSPFCGGGAGQYGVLQAEMLKPCAGG